MLLTHWRLKNIAQETILQQNNSLMINVIEMFITQQTHILISFIDTNAT